MRWRRKQLQRKGVLESRRGRFRHQALQMLFLRGREWRKFVWRRATPAELPALWGLGRHGWCLVTGGWNSPDAERPAG